MPGPRPGTRPDGLSRGCDRADGGVGPGRVVGGLAGLDPLPRASWGAGPVVVVHGAADPVIPGSQSVVLAERRRAAGRPVRLLVTPLLRHGDAGASMGTLVRAGPAAAAAFGAFCAGAAAALG